MLVGSGALLAHGPGRSRNAFAEHRRQMAHPRPSRCRLGARGVPGHARPARDAAQLDRGLRRPADATDRGPCPVQALRDRSLGPGRAGPGGGGRAHRGPGRPHALRSGRTAAVAGDLAASRPERSRPPRHRPPHRQRRLVDGHHRAGLRLGLSGARAGRQGAAPRTAVAIRRFRRLEPRGSRWRHARARGTLLEGQARRSVPRRGARGRFRRTPGLRGRHDRPPPAPPPDQPTRRLRPRRRHDLLRRRLCGPARPAAAAHRSLRHRRQHADGGARRSGARGARRPVRQHGRPAHADGRAAELHRTLRRRAPDIRGRDRALRLAVRPDRPACVAGQPSGRLRQLHRPARLHRRARQRGLPPVRHPLPAARRALRPERHLGRARGRLAADLRVPDRALRGGHGQGPGRPVRGDRGSGPPRPRRGHAASSAGQACEAAASGRALAAAPHRGPSIPHRSAGSGSRRPERSRRSSR